LFSSNFINYRAVNRETIDDYKFKNITIPSEMVIQVPVYNIYKDPEYLDNPEMFIPERLANNPLL
jgi:cytochrome P450